VQRSQKFKLDRKAKHSEKLNETTVNSLDFQTLRNFLLAKTLNAMSLIFAGRRHRRTFVCVDFNLHDGVLREHHVAATRNEIVID
jgi:hypothetical protein